MQNHVIHRFLFVAGECGAGSGCGCGLCGKRVLVEHICQIVGLHLRLELHRPVDVALCGGLEAVLQRDLAEVAPRCSDVAHQRGAVHCRLRMRTLRFLAIVLLCCAVAIAAAGACLLLVLCICLFLLRCLFCSCI